MISLINRSSFETFVHQSVAEKSLSLSFLHIYEMYMYIQYMCKLRKAKEANEERYSMLRHINTSAIIQ